MHNHFTLYLPKNKSVEVCKSAPPHPPCLGTYQEKSDFSRSKNSVFPIPNKSNYLGYVPLTHSHISCIPVVAPELHLWLFHMVGIHVIMRYLANYSACPEL